jgi:UrcA family protein
MTNTANSITRNIVGAFGALVLGVAFVGAATGPAHAATVTTVSQTVRYGDLNINNAAGRAALDARVRAAAKSVCTVDLNGLAARIEETRCFDAAVANAKSATKA